MKKLLIIMNPHAGQMQANKDLTGIVDLFCKEGYWVEVAMTQEQGDGIRIASERAEESDIIVAIGGDGTFNEVVSGSFGKDVTIGYIPAGTTNDFASGIGLEKSTLKAAATIISGEPRKIDLGSFNGRHFSYVASFGAFTNTSYDVPQDLKNAIGHAAYILSGIKDVVNIKPLDITVRSDGEEYTGDYIFGAICNSTSMGGIINLKESDVDMNDGLLEVMLIKSPNSILELQQILFALTTQSYDDCEQISFFSTSKAEITAPEDMPWTLDGEYQEGARNIVIENLMSAVTLMVPSAG